MKTLELIPVAVDFETYFDRDYSLKKMMTAAYILDPRFQIIGCSIAIGNQDRWRVGARDARAALASLPWDRCLFIAHHAFFDGLIAEWHCGIKPARYFCTMMGSRPYCYQAIGKMGLANVLPYLGLGEKGNAVGNFAGRRLETFTAEELASYGAYSMNDARGAYNIAAYLRRLMPDREQELLDLTVKKFTRTQLVLDKPSVSKWLNHVRTKRQLAVMDLQAELPDLTPTKLKSRPQFAGLLANYGVEIPMKPSPSNPEEETYAFAKTDFGLLDLRGHENRVVRDLVEARLMFSSNQEESRLERFEQLASLTPDSQLFVPLLYYGTHPGRLSGYDGYNLQNLPRVDKDIPGSEALKSCLWAPPGYVILAADSSQIECRILGTLAGQFTLVEDFRANADIYSGFASDFYKKPINKRDNPTERFVGKTCTLGLGYGMSWQKLQRQLRLKGVHLTDNEAKEAVNLYRYKKFPKIPELWHFLEERVRGCAEQSHLSVWGPLSFAHERIILPNGMNIWYPGLRAHLGLEYQHPRYGMTGIWGGHIAENVCQALARIIITDAEVRLARAGLRAALQVHDELVFVVREEHVERCRRAVELAMTAPVSWLPLLPLACEVKWGRSYAEAK